MRDCMRMAPMIVMFKMGDSIYRSFEGLFGCLFLFSPMHVCVCILFFLMVNVDNSYLLPLIEEKTALKTLDSWWHTPSTWPAEAGAFINCPSSFFLTHFVSYSQSDSPCQYTGQEVLYDIFQPLLSNQSLVCVWIKCVLLCCRFSCVLMAGYIHCFKEWSMLLKLLNIDF